MDTFATLSLVSASCCTIIFSFIIVNYDHEEISGAAHKCDQYIDAGDYVGS